jgi:hypothetical protein
LSSANPQSIVADQTDTYVVTGYSVQGCAASDSLIVSVSALPALSFSVDPDTVCGDHASIGLNAVPAGGVFNGTGVSSAAFDPIAAGAGNHAITYTFTNADGCAASVSSGVTVNGAPPIDAGADITACQGSIVVLTASGGEAYSWAGLSAANPQSIVADQTDTYVVTGYSAEGCSGIDSLVVTVSVVPALSFAVDPDTLCSYDNAIVLSATPSGGVFSGAGVGAGTFDPSVAGPGTHTILYTFTNADECAADTSYAVFVSACLGLEEQESLQVHVYPNPFEDFLVIESEEAGFSIELFDMKGVVVRTFSSAKPGKLELDGLERGTYLLKVRGRKGERVMKVVKL